MEDWVKVLQVISIFFLIIIIIVNISYPCINLSTECSKTQRYQIATEQ